jgi:hypothetical protein
VLRTVLWTSGLTPYSYPFGRLWSEHCCSQKQDTIQRHLWAGPGRLALKPLETMRRNPSSPGVGLSSSRLPTRPLFLTALLDVLSMSQEIIKFLFRIFHPFRIIWSWYKKKWAHPLGKLKPEKKKENKCFDLISTSYCIIDGDIFLLSRERMLTTPHFLDCRGVRVSPRTNSWCACAPRQLLIMSNLVEKDGPVRASVFKLNNANGRAKRDGHRESFAPMQS